jgi:hypothetical protein
MNLNWECNKKNEYFLKQYNREEKKNKAVNYE